MSGIYEMGGGPDHVYFGPAATLGARSATAGLIRSELQVMVAAAELDLPIMVQQAHALDDALTSARRPHDFLVADKGWSHRGDLFD